MALTVPQLMGLGMPGPLATAIVGGDSGGGGNPTVTVSLTAAQLNHMHSSPITLVAAPGSGNIAVPLYADLIYKVGSVTYYTGPNNDHPQISIGSAYLQTAETALLTLDTLTSCISRVTFSRLINLDNSAIDPSASQNQPILLGNTTGDLILYGNVTACSLSAGGSGYSINDTGGFNEGFSGGSYTVTAVDGGGAVTSFTFSDLNGVRVGDVVTSYDITGAGSGFSVLINTIVPGNGTATLQLTYKIVAIP